MIFVDTSAWYAAYVPSDGNQERVAELLTMEDDVVVTTDFVVDETITLLLARGERRRAVKFGEDLLRTEICRLELVTLADLSLAYDLICRFDDKHWSFTDCTSFVVMRRLPNARALTLDNDFRQMPGIVVVELNA
jgi:predicted nucleic acid-binding protein